MNECKCTMAQSLTGDGCRYCQPQEYINRLHEQLEENDNVITEIIGQVAALRDEIPKSNKRGAKFFSAGLLAAIQILERYK